MEKVHRQNIMKICWRLIRISSLTFIIISNHQTIFRMIEVDIFPITSHITFSIIMKIFSIVIMMIESNLGVIICSSTRIFFLEKVFNQNLFDVSFIIVATRGACFVLF